MTACGRPSTATTTEVPPCALADRRASVDRLRCEATPRSASQTGRPTSTVRPSTTPVDARGRCAVRASRRCGQRVRPPGGRDDRRRQRVGGGRLDGRGQPEQRAGVVARQRIHAGDPHLTGGDGAGLVEHDGVDPAGLLEHLGAADQDAELSASAGAGQQRGRRGQPEGARAGDDQHGDRGGERAAGVVGGEQPAGQRQAGQQPGPPARRRRRSGRPAVAPAPCRSARR